jgi:hypothetical protein
MAFVVAVAAKRDEIADELVKQAFVGRVMHVRCHGFHAALAQVAVSLKRF